MRKQIFFLSVGLILLALCSCDKTMQNETETNATMAKVRRRATTMFQASELGNFFVNPDLDAEFQLSEAEIVDELMSYGFLESGETMDITPIYFERIIPIFFKSLIVEPESNEWYGINVDEVLNTYIEFPSIAFYIINTPTKKAFLTTADKRYGCNLIEYCTPSFLDPELVTAYEYVIDDLYTNEASANFEQFDSLMNAFVRDAMELSKKETAYNFKKYMALGHLQYYDPGAGNYCGRSNSYIFKPLLRGDFRWGQYDFFGDCDHNMVSGSIAISILKILCKHEYSCVLLGNYFDAMYLFDMDMLRSAAWRIYYELEDAGENRSSHGLDILSSCGFEIYTRNEYLGTEVLSRLETGRLSIAVMQDGRWQLVDGYALFETSCNIEYKYDYDRNMCESDEENWGYLHCPGGMFFYTY